MKNGKLFLLLLMISLLIFFFDKKGWIGPVKNIASKPVAVMERGIWEEYLRVRDVGGIWGVRGRQEEIQRLEEKLRQLAVQQNQLSSCLEENEKIKKLLGAPLPAQWKFMEARVIGISEKMRIDKGKKDGVKVGMVVISENILVGKVVLVNDNDSLVELVSDPVSKIPVVVKRPGSAGVQGRGLLFGQTNGSLRLDQVLQNEDIQKGDLVVSEGNETWVPELVIGQIEKVGPKSAEVYRKAEVLPLISYRELRIVFLVIK